jgi:uncharacterized protein (TIGR00369 family)
MLSFVEMFIARTPHAQALGMSLVSCDPTIGQVVLSQPWREDLVGDPSTGVLHGGVITAFLDTLTAACVIARGVRPQATLDLRIDYLRPAPPRIALVGDASCYRLTRHIAFVRGVCHQGDPEHAVANLTATFMLQEAKS